MNDQSHRPPQEKVCGYEYTVRRGDSFYLIANRLGIPLRDLLEANSHINPARLMVGDVLCIPMEEDDKPPEQAAPELPAVPETPSIPEAPVPEAPAEEAPAEPPEEFYPDMTDNLDLPALPSESTAEEGSCAEENRYAVRQGESIADIQLRADVNRYTLEKANPSVDIDHLSAGQTLCVPKESTACPHGTTYILQKEETLESVALRLNTSLAALLRANPCLAPSDFVAGRCIEIP